MSSKEVLPVQYNCRTWKYTHYTYCNMTRHVTLRYYYGIIEIQHGISTIRHDIREIKEHFRESVESCHVKHKY